MQLKQERENKSIPTEKENEEYIYDYNVGDNVYLGSSEYKITSISNDDIVFLYDTQFPLLEKEMKLDEFENALKESIFNDHLKTPKSTINSYTNYFRLYELKETSKYRDYRDKDELTIEECKKRGIELTQDDYDLIYEGNWDELKGISSENRLEYIWEKFNVDIPENFRGHSLSVSDVITVGNEDIQTAYYVDSIGFTDFPEFFKEKELEKVVENEPLQNNIPTITCEWSEHSIFEKGKTYSVSEFDELMENADRKWIKNRREEVEKYGSMEEAIEATGVTYQGYAKTKFTINMPDGSSYTERQDIGDGFCGVIDFLSQYPQYNDIVPVLKAQIAIERNTPIQDVLNTSEVQEQPISNTKSVDELQIGDVIRLENQEWTISKIDGDFSVELINNDKTANNSVQKFMGHWKENIAEIGFEYVPTVEKKDKKHTYC